MKCEAGNHKRNLKRTLKFNTISCVEEESLREFLKAYF